MIDPDQVSHGSDDMLRMTFAECMGWVAWYASKASEYSMAQHDTQAEINGRQAVAAMKQALSIQAMLKSGKSGGRTHG